MGSGVLKAIAVEIGRSLGFAGAQSRLVIFSVDHAEEVHRESREIQDPAWDCTLIKTMREHGDTTVNMIYDWTDTDVWDFIKDRQIEINPLYGEGWNRVGCVLCPLAKRSEKTMMCERYPKYKQAYITAFDRMIHDDAYRQREGATWKTGEDVFDWWLEADGTPGQMSLFD